jgi:hypothetical protein
MKQRSRLSLSRSRQVDKKPPPGFEGEPPDSPDDARVAPKEPSKSTSGAESVSPGPDVKPRSSSLFDTRKLAKIFVVVGLGALSLYLLKRRFSL